MLARALTTQTIAQRCQLLERFQEVSFRGNGIRRTSMISWPDCGPVRSRSEQSRGDVLHYLTHPGYGWGEFCERTFGDIPSQFCFEWNTPRHTTDDAVPAQLRAHQLLDKGR